MLKPQTSKKQTSAVKSYHLIAAQVLFVDPKTEETGAANFNTLVITDDGNIARRHIDKAQRAVQFLFFQRMGSAEFKVLDVFLLNICHLGSMTEEEFHKKNPPSESAMMAMDTNAVLGTEGAING